MERRRFFYRKKENNTICLLRCFGENSCAQVPEYIDGLPVTEIGAYCFAENGHLDRVKYEITGILANNEMDMVPDACRYEFDPIMPDISASKRTSASTAASGCSPASAGSENTTDCILAEQCGRYLTEVILPDTVTRLNAYAFYGCRSLKTITFSLNLRDIENDAFMNCTKLSRLNITNSMMNPGSLKQILAQISWNVETAFYPKKASENEMPSGIGNSWSRNTSSILPEAVLFFPEYLEYYDDLGPAHVFEIQIEGEGYRARQCFQDGVLMPGEYDATFQKISDEERASTACRFALDRFLYPAWLTEANRILFSGFLRKHPEETCGCLMDWQEERPEEMMRAFEIIVRDHVLEKDDLDHLLTQVSEKGMAELAASLIKWKSMYYKEEKKADPYSFDDFF